MRVPVSIVVRMNSASNMMAKWYQYFHSELSVASAEPPIFCAMPSKMLAMPTARVTAPPVRPRRLSCVRDS